MIRYGFVIDLKRCYACYSCQVTCKAEHLTPPGTFWARVLKGETGKYPNVTRQALPILCMQCGEPECVKVCPTKATVKRQDGVVTIDKNLCIGCRYCIVTCPYGSRYFCEKWARYFPDGDSAPFEDYQKKVWLETKGEGTVSKCEFCIDRVEKGMEPACVENCPANARYFGDLEDPQSEVSMLIKQQRGFQLNPEYGGDPSVYYLPPR